MLNQPISMPQEYGTYDNGHVNFKLVFIKLVFFVVFWYY